jgi:hypothetical protein
MDPTLEKEEEDIVTTVENEVIVVSQHWPWIPVLPLLFLLSKNYL